MQFQEDVLLFQAIFYSLAKTNWDSQPHKIPDYLNCSPSMAVDHLSVAILYYFISNNNLSNSLQYVHTAENPFDFNDANTPAGFHRINDSDSFKNPPTDITNAATLNYGNVFVCKSNNQSDTLSMTFYPCFNNTVFMKTANTTSWKDKGWVQFVSKSDLWPQSSGTEITAGTDMQTITLQDITVVVIMVWLLH